MIGSPPPLEGPRVTLDQASFRALASEVRVDVLKRLDERRATVTDLSNAMNLSKPTLLEHLEKLQNAGLVRRVDEGRKWIYYELTQKGRRILHPEKVTIVVSLCLSFFLGSVGVIAIAAGLTMAVSGPGLSGGDGVAAMSVGLDLPDPLLLGFGLTSTALWFVGLALYVKVQGDERRRRMFEELQAMGSEPGGEPGRVL